MPGELVPGGVRNGRVTATMWHGSMESDEFRSAYLAGVSPGRAPSGVSFASRRAERLDLLADLMEEHVDVPALLDLALSGAPAGLPMLPPGDRLCS